MIKYNDSSIVLQEVPNEVSLAFSITNCPMRCLYCHSPHLRKDIGTELTVDKLKEELDKCRSPHTGKYTVTCVLFFGGDQHEEELIELLKICKDLGLKTCLYTGKNKITINIQEHLDYVKLGDYREDLGALDSKTTNQRFIRLSDFKDLTYLFWENE